MVFLMMMRLGPHTDYEHDHRTSLRDIILLLHRRLKPVDDASEVSGAVTHNGATWTPMATFTLAYCRHVVYSSTRSTRSAKWVFDIDEFGWAGIREPTYGYFDSYCDLINNVAQALVKRWKLGMPIHKATAPQPMSPTFVAPMIEASLASVENPVATSIIHALTAHPGNVDSILVTTTTQGSIKQITSKLVTLEDGYILENHRVDFRRTDPYLICETLDEFWDASREEFIRRTWHPSRLLTWCLPHDEVADIQTLQSEDALTT